MSLICRLIVLTICLLVAHPALAQPNQIKIATFAVDASPPVGSPLAYDPTIAIEDPLSCRGIVILSDADPIVLCCVDWLGVANDAQIEFKQALAKSANTTADRVAIHAVHQHDAPRCDLSAAKLLAEQGIADSFYDTDFIQDVIQRTGAAIEQSLPNAQPVTHLGVGQAKVEKVASNRRILGEDGKVKVTRYTATADPQVRAFPTGTIDPQLKSISFWNLDQPVAVLTFYATHPQSYYRTGRANPDFPGMARNARQQETGVPHIHFNGAGGNIGAGKWNDGSKENRPVLAGRVQQAMQQAWQQTKRQPVDANSLDWKSLLVKLPPSPFLDEGALADTLANPDAKPIDRLYAAKHLVWLRRAKSKQSIQLSCWKLNDARILLMPGELFVEYQLQAQAMAPNEFVALAAYGEYGMGYIGTAIAYSQGGYETSARASRVDRGCEKILLDGMKQLLGD